MVEAKCIVCMEDDLKKTFRLGCGHKFHLSCLRSVVENLLQPACPMCRAPMRKSFVEATLRRRSFRGADPAETARWSDGQRISMYKRAFFDRHHRPVEFEEDGELMLMNARTYQLALSMRAKWLDADTLDEAHGEMRRLKRLRRRYRWNIPSKQDAETFGDVPELVHVGEQEELTCDYLVEGTGSLLGSKVVCDVPVEDKHEYHCADHVQFQ